MNEEERRELRDRIDAAKRTRMKFRQRKPGDGNWTPRGRGTFGQYKLFPDAEEPACGCCDGRG